MAKRVSRRLKGSFEDKGRWIKCWNCGFHIDIDRVSVGDGNGLRIKEFPPPNPSPVSSGDPLLSKLYFDRFDMVGCLPLEGEEMFYNRMSVSVSGCPFCGTKNLP